MGVEAKCRPSGMDLRRRSERKLPSATTDPLQCSLKLTVEEEPASVLATSYSRLPWEGVEVEVWVQV